MQATEADGNLPLDIDPKLAWATEVPRALSGRRQPRQPRGAAARAGSGRARAVDQLVASRRHRTLRLDDVARLTVSITKVRPFLTTADWRPTLLTDRADLRALLAPRTEQLELFAT